MLSGVLDVLFQVALPFHRGMVGRSWVFPPWSLPGWAVGTGTAEFLAGDRQGNAFIYCSLGEGPRKQGDRKGTAGEFGSMVKGCGVVGFDVVFQEWRVTRDRDTWTQVRGQKG